MTRERLVRAALSIPRRVLLPEGVLLGLLLALPLLPSAAPFVEGRAMAVLLVVGLAGAALGWRFARGRLVHGLMVLGAATALPLLPADGPAATLGTLLVPLNLAAIALLPDRGILTRGGLLRTGAIAIQVLLVGGLAGAAPTGSGGLARMTLPGLGMEVDPVLVVHGTALAAAALLALGRGTASARGSLWAIAAALAAPAGAPGGPAWALAAGGALLVVAAVEDAYALAYRDALTGLPSRRALDELPDRTARRFTVAMVDVDHFKPFNDRHGHDVGDQVLRLVATKLKEAGGGARAFRYGGEEFTLVFRGRSLEEARPWLDDVRESIADASFGVRGRDRPANGRSKRSLRLLRGRGPLKQLKVTVSIGAAERGDRSTPPGDVLKAADAALYRAKKAGRNRVAVAGSR